MSKRKKGPSREFQLWANAFAASELGKKALEKLKDLDTDGDLAAFDALREKVLKACYQAQLLRDRPNEDDFERHQGHAKDFLASSGDLRKALKRLRISAEAHPYHFAMAAKEASATLNIQAKPNEGRPDAIARAFLETFERLDAGLEDFASDARVTAGTIAGCLEYPKDIRNQRAKPDYAENGLIFELALIFKHWTGLRTLVIAHPSAMPKTGRPCYPLVAAFTNAALGSAAHGELRSGAGVGDKLKKLIQNHKGITYVGWSE